MPQVKCTRHLERFFPALAEGPLMVQARSAAEAVQAVEARLPGFAGYVLDEHGALRQHVNVFIDNVMIEDRQRLSDPVAPESTVFIFQALTGG